MPLLWQNELILCVWLIVHVLSGAVNAIERYAVRFRDRPRVSGIPQGVPQTGQVAGRQDSGTRRKYTF